MVTQAPKRSAIAIALVFVLSCVGLIIFVWTQFGGPIPLAPQGYRIKVVFNETGLLVPNADVRISGVNVGHVVSVEAEGTHSLVTMDIGREFAPIPVDTQAILREKTLLGEAYVQLSTGNRSAGMLSDGGTIPPGQVHATEQLDNVLDAFTAPVRADLQALLTGTGSALAGSGQDLNDAFGNLDPATAELSALVGTLDDQQQDVQKLISSSATVLTTLGERGEQLQQLVSAGNAVVSTTGTESRALTGTVDALPGFLAQLQTTLRTLGHTLTLSRPSLEELTPVAPLLAPALHGITATSGSLDDLLRTAPSVLRDANESLPEVTAFVNALRGGMNALLPATEQIVPMIDIASEYKRNVINGMVNFAASAQAQTGSTLASGTWPDVGNGQAKYLRSLLTLGPDTLFGASTRDPAIRNNTYFAPGELARIGHGGMRASTCSGAGSGNVPCALQPIFNWGYGIGKSYFPRVKRATP